MSKARIVFPSDDGFTALPQLILQAINSEDEVQARIHLTEAVTNRLTEVVEQVVKNISETSLFSILGIEDDSGNTLLHLAASLNRTEIIAILVGGVSLKNQYYLLKLKNRNGVTPLLLAITQMHFETPQWILNLPLTHDDMKDIVTTLSKFGITALSAATAAGSTVLIKPLVEILGDGLYNQLLVTDSQGDNVLHIAAKNGKGEIALCLLQSMDKIQAANILQMENSKGLNPIACAKDQGEDDFISAIQEYQGKMEITTNGEQNKLYVE